jgi:CheY-like chemotaxis protein
VQKILIADADARIREVVRAVLSVQPQLEILEPANGAEALGLPLFERPAPALVALALPGPRGDDVCRSIQAEPALTHTALLGARAGDSNG